MVSTIRGSAIVPDQGESQVGRYQIVFNPAVRQDTFLLDTVEGRIWTPIRYTDIQGEPIVWQYSSRVDNFQELLTWFESFK